MQGGGDCRIDSLQHGHLHHPRSEPDRGSQVSRDRGSLPVHTPSEGDLSLTPPGRPVQQFSSTSPDRSRLASSQPTDCSICALQDARPEPCPHGDPDFGNLEHDVPGLSNNHPARPGKHRGLTTDKGDTAPALIPPPGGRAGLSSHPRTPGPSSAPSPSTPSRISAPREPTNPPGSFPDGDPDGRTVEYGAIRNAGHERDVGPTHHWTGPADPCRTEAVLISSPSNRTVFATLAAGS